MDTTVRERVKYLKKRAVPILKKAGVIRSDLFGSYTRTKIQKKSDIDLLVEFNPKMKVSLFDLIGLKQDLEDIFGRKVDVITYKGLHPLIKQNVEAEMITILK